MDMATSAGTSVGLPTGITRFGGFAPSTPAIEPFG
jgi:hypothetical protein